MKVDETIKQCKFDIGETVEFAIPSGKDTGLVDEVVVCEDGLLYGVIWSNKSHGKHYGFELKNKSS